MAHTWNEIEQIERQKKTHCEQINGAIVELIGENQKLIPRICQLAICRDVNGIGWSD